MLNTKARDQGPQIKIERSSPPGLLKNFAQILTRLMASKAITRLAVLLLATMVAIQLRTKAEAIRFPAPNFDEVGSISPFGDRSPLRMDMDMDHEADLKMSNSQPTDLSNSVVNGEQTAAPHRSGWKPSVQMLVNKHPPPPNGNPKGNP